MAKLSYLPALEDANAPLSDKQLEILEEQVESEMPNPSIQSQFNYAWGLIKCSSKKQNKKGIDLLVDIFKNCPQRRRECLYYLSVGCLKINDLSEAKRYIDALVNHEPDNLQAAQLQRVVEDKIAKGKYQICSKYIYDLGI
ncbi:hypothetical protein PACTADRAFT_51136 [Pachysolen tannophilus NRRL Y-2460]|uniref:Mitochondrial fission 1 protein n=1 Tax=Pachysolen tannophilus NRRL Y-2460 TaxID=669874 RepID=A0A1E4TR75_PACTA|nr:hypothetical protein PACTADRAFT_51136 [Pachysolen tannophilus NRRL Y-2460]